MDTSKTTVRLSDDDAIFVDDRIASGAYRSASEVVQAGLVALREKEGEFDDWLRKEVVPVYEKLKADPTRGIPAESGFAELRARYADDRPSED